MAHGGTGTFFLDLAGATWSVGYSLFADFWGLSARPLALAYFAPEGWPMAANMLMILQGGLYINMVFTLSLMLLWCSVASIYNGIAFGRLLTVLFAADGLAQLPILLWPSLTESFSWPMSLTGLFAIQVQLSWCLPFALLGEDYEKATIWLEGGFFHITTSGDDLKTRLRLLKFAIPLRYTALTVAQHSAAAMWGLYGLSMLLGLFVATPRSVWELLERGAVNASRLLVRLLSAVYATFEYVYVYVWPKVRELALSVLHHRLLVGLHRALVVPAWELLSPWALPAAMLGAVSSLVLSLADLAAAGPPADAVAVLDGLARLLGTASAAVSFFILTLNAVLRGCFPSRRAMPDPLRSDRLTAFLDIWARAISFAWWQFWALWRPFCERAWTYVVSPVLEVLANALWGLVKFALMVPFLMLPLIIIFNVFLIRHYASIREAVAAFLAEGPAARVLQALQGALGSVGATDSGLAIWLILAVQVGAYHTIACVLESVRAVRSVRNVGHALSLEELNDLAAAMGQPRQCARCGFGPVDHTGCHDLQAHHLQVAVAGGRSRVSNACPRCGWFTRRLQDWPTWDGELQTAAGRAVFRQRTWAEVVLVTRASSKAFLFPYLLLLLGGRLGLPPSLSAFLALSYLVPWILENWKLAVSITNPKSFRARRRETTPEGPTPDVSGRGGPGPAARAEDSCGRQPAAEALLPPISQSKALRNILTSCPSRVFLRDGDACSVCLENFSAEAVAVAGDSGTGSPVKELCLSLQRLRPSVATLRCGHALHVKCAEAAVQAAGARHVRCPLCREPVTLAGDVTAAMFS